MEAELSDSSIGVVVTRGEGPDGPLSTILKDRGARVLNWGTIAFAPPEDSGPLEAALGRLKAYDWICYPSPRAVQAVVTRVQDPPSAVRCAAVGPTTADALTEAGWPVDRLPAEGNARGLVEAFRAAGDAAGTDILLPASAISREELPRGLRELGARVDLVTAYRMVTLPLDGVACERAVDEGEVQVITFASPSAMEGLRESLGQEVFRRLAEDIPAAAMGPTTGAALSEAGWGKVVLAAAPTVDGLAHAALMAASESAGENN